MEPFKAGYAEYIQKEALFEDMWSGIKEWGHQKLTDWSKSKEPGLLKNIGMGYEIYNRPEVQQAFKDYGSGMSLEHAGAKAMGIDPQLVDLGKKITPLYQGIKKNWKPILGGAAALTVLPYVLGSFSKGFSSSPKERPFSGGSGSGYMGYKQPRYSPQSSPMQNVPKFQHTYNYSNY